MTNLKEKVVPIDSTKKIKTSGSQMEAWHFDNDGAAVHGTGRKKNLEPYLCFEFVDIKVIPTSTLPVWLMLLRQWHVTREEWVSIPKRLAVKAGVSRHQLSRSFTALENLGFIDVQKKAGKSTRARRK